VILFDKRLRTTGLGLLSNIKLSYFWLDHGSSTITSVLIPTNANTSRLHEYQWRLVSWHYNKRPSCNTWCII